MEVMLCVDDKGGTGFNKRRQSRDRLVVEDMLAYCGGRALAMNAYSAALFAEGEASLVVAEDFFLEAPEDAVRFVEAMSLGAYEPQIDKLILYCWNRHYPADVFFDIPLDAHGWRLVAEKELAGYSHEKITRKEYVK